MGLRRLDTRSVLSSGTPIEKIRNDKNKRYTQRNAIAADHSPAAYYTKTDTEDGGGGGDI